MFLSTKQGPEPQGPCIIRVSRLPQTKEAGLRRANKFNTTLSQLPDGDTETSGIQIRVRGLRALPAFAEDLGLVPSIHIGAHTAYRFSSKGFRALFWPLPAHAACKLTQAHIYT